MMLLRRAGGVKQDVLLQPSFCSLAMQCFRSQTRARAAVGISNYERVNRFLHWPLRCDRGGPRGWVQLALCKTLAIT